MQLNADMQAPHKNQYIPYLNWKTPFRSLMEFQITEDGLLQSIFQAPSGINLKRTWDTHYLEQFPETSKQIATDTMSSEIKKSLKNSVMSYVLPKIKLTQELSLQAKHLRKNAQVIAIEISAKPNK